MRCSVSSRLVYFTPKLSTTRQEYIGRDVCLNKPGGFPVGTYPPDARCLTNLSYAMRPACGRQYIPFDISAATMSL